MKILMISLDKGFLSEKPLGDSIERHKKYGSFCEKLDIVVLSKRGFSKKNLSEKVSIYPTSSLTRYNYFFDIYKVGKKLFKQNKYDLITSEFFGSLPAWLLKKKNRSKLLLNIHGDFFNNKKALESLWHNYVLLLINNFIIKKSDGIRVVSQGIKQKLINKGIDEKKIRVISTPIELDKFFNFSPPLGGVNKKETLPKVSKNFKTILFVGRLEKVKNLDWFLNIFEKIKEDYKNVKFVIIGKGSQEKKLKSKAINGVEFLGHLSHNEIIKYLNNSDIFVLPSKSESFGKVLVEANACGKPLIATNTTGAKEIIQDGINGFLIPIGNAEKMSEKILYLLNNPEKAKQIGENGKKIVKEKYSNNLEKIIEFWKDLTKE